MRCLECERSPFEKFIIEEDKYHQELGGSNVQLAAVMSTSSFLCLLESSQPPPLIAIQQHGSRSQEQHQCNLQRWKQLIIGIGDTCSKIPLEIGNKHQVTWILQDY